MRIAMFAKLNAYPTTAHFVGHGNRSAGTEEKVEHQVAGIAGDVQD